MSHEVKWTKQIFDEFVAEAMLSDTEVKILKTRIQGWSIVQQALEFQLSVSAVNRVIRNLKDKYDEVQKYDPILPKRETSKDIASIFK